MNGAWMHEQRANFGAPGVKTVADQKGLNQA
jgi:hypothetical protein